MTDASTPEAELLRTLACVLDEIIPPSADGKLPGAGALGVGEGFAASPELRPVIEQGVGVVDALARERGAAGYVALPAGERRGVLEASAAKAPAFLPTLIAQTLVVYYQDASVLEALGFRAGPPFPRGFTVEPTDFSLLDPVRERPPFFREP